MTTYGKKNSHDVVVLSLRATIGWGTWWTDYHNFRGCEHREKIGPKSLAQQAYDKRKTQVREDLLFPEAVARQ